MFTDNFEGRMQSMMDHLRGMEPVLKAESLKEDGFF